MTKILDEFDWNKLNQVFDQVSNMTEEERRALLTELQIKDASLFHELGDLLSLEEDSEDFLESPIKIEFPPAGTHHFVGKKIGPYTIVREIARGGMGIALEAVRTDGEFEQRVAIKIMDRGLFAFDLVERFRRERQIHASLEHPNIVTLMDGGVTEQSLPFFIMEFVDGKRIDEYCRVNELDIDARCKLFLQICDAVGHAHRRLVVHRDLKPSNILVNQDGQVKLLDFGIAKMVESDAAFQTLTRGAPLTPGYSSPEQIRGKSISTLCDIFSLGIVFCEMICSASPNEIFGVDKMELPAAICKSEHIPPSRLAAKGSPFSRLSRQKKNDLEKIIAKALRKEPDQRYSSTELFADDIRAFLNGLPVKAHPPSIKYRASKFIRRNFYAAAGTLAALLLIVFGASAAVWQSRIAVRNQKLAEDRFEQVRKVANSLIFDYHDEIAKLEGSTKLREKLVVDAVNYLNAISQGDLSDPALVKELAVAYRKIADVYGSPYNSNLGRLEDALINHQKSVALLEKAATDLPSDLDIKVELVQSLQQLSIAFSRNEDPESAKSCIFKAIRIAETMPDVESVAGQNRLLRIKLHEADTSWSIRERLDKYTSNLPAIEALQNKYPNDETLIRLRLIYESRSGNAAKWLGFDAADAGDPDAAMRFYQTSLVHHQNNLSQSELFESLFPDDARNTVGRFVAHINLADVFVRLRRPEDAKTHLKIAKTAVAKMQEDPDNKEARKDDLDVFNTEQDLLIYQEDVKAAIKLLEKSISLADELMKADSKNVEILMFKIHFVQKAVKIMKNQTNRAEAEKYLTLQSRLEQTLRTDFNYKGEMKFYF